MKVSGVKGEAEWAPLTIQIILETREEAARFHAVMNNNIIVDFLGIPGAAARRLTEDRGIKGDREWELLREALVNHYKKYSS